MIHLVLPLAGVSSLDISTRLLAETYGQTFLKRFLQTLEKHGALRESMEATLIAGSPLWKSGENCQEPTMQFVREFLNEHDIPMLVEYLEGSHPKKIHFTHSYRHPEVKHLQALASAVGAMRPQRRQAPTPTSCSQNVQHLFFPRCDQSWSDPHVCSASCHACVRRHRDQSSHASLRRLPATKKTYDNRHIRSPTCKPSTRPCT